MFFNRNKKDHKTKDKSAALEEEKEQELLDKKRLLIHKDMLKYEESNRKKPKKAPDGCCISLQHINKIYPNHVQAVYDFNLDIKEKEFIVLVGPSGCGKSTTLRMIAGLEDITAGDLYINGMYANDLEPINRDIAMVFQSYALYPHMTVYENIAFGLEMRHCKKDYIDEQVHKAAKILQLDDFLDRKPGQLSGGQRQRVALGRAIVKNSKVFLMDEPLSNLDAKLRVQMRSEIVKLHKSLNATTIYVTHDQTEAMTMASRIVIMKEGRVQQIGTPKEIYSNPANEFVAVFIGSPGMNLVRAQVNKSEKRVEFENGLNIPLSNERMKVFNEFFSKKMDSLYKKNEELNEKIKTIKVEDEKESLLIKEVNQAEIASNEKMIDKYKEVIDKNIIDVDFGLRPEDLAQKEHSQLINNKSDSFKADVTIAELLGNEYYVHTSIGNTEIVGKFNANNEVESYSTINVVMDVDRIHLFDNISSEKIF